MVDPQAGGTRKTRVVIWLQATHQFSVIIVSKGKIGSGLCIPSKNQKRLCSDSRRASAKCV